MLSEKVELISAKGLTKDLINGYNILKGAKYFSSGVLRNVLVFISANKCIELLSGIQQICPWKSKGTLEKGPRGSNNTYAPRLIDYRPLPHVKFARNRLRLSSIFLIKM